MLHGKKGNGSTINDWYSKIVVITVGAPQVCSTMHKEKTVEASRNIQSINGRQGEKRKNGLCLCRDVNGPGTAVYSRKDDRFVGDPTSS